VLGWLVALLLVALYVVGSKVLLVSMHVKLQKLRHRIMPSKVVPTCTSATEATTEHMTKHALSGDSELTNFAERAGLPLNPGDTSADSDIVRVVHIIKCGVVWLLSHRSLLIFLGSAGFTPIASQLLAALACSYPEDSITPAAHPAHPPISMELVCWDSTHLIYVYGSVAAMGMFVPLVMLATPLVAAAARLSDRRTVVVGQLPIFVIQWGAGYASARTMVRFVLVLLAVLLPDSALTMDAAALIMCFALATLAIFVQPCSVHAVLKLHVVVLISVCCTASVSLRYQLHRESISEECPEVEDAFWLLLLLWGGLMVLSLTYQYWWGLISNFARAVGTCRANAKRNRAVADMTYTNDEGD
jgi:hypothetical protein